MSKAKETFDAAIQDAEELLDHFDRVNTGPPPKNAEVLKRAGLIMACTAWETYVEDRVLEGLEARITKDGDGFFAAFTKDRLQEELKKLHNPNAEKTAKLFADYLGVDITNAWNWNGYDEVKAKNRLNEWLGKRGDAVHRSRPVTSGPPNAHLVTRDEL